ncbi:MAG: transglutaminase-like domain-containing protein [Fimbriimonas sp.]
MNLQPDSPHEAYLQPCPMIDFDHPRIQAFLDASGWRDLPETERTRKAYEFVRDEVPHAWDVQSSVVTCAASEVLAQRVGICYAKSHLLAALLRGMEVPAGLCYQRLVLFDDPVDGFAIHALNAAFLKEAGRWVRMDARGNKPGVDARFDLENERLAFPVRPEMGEEDEGIIHAVPAACTVAALQGHADMRSVYATGLPSRL